jgi:hypothetical protein
MLLLVMGCARTTAINTQSVSNNYQQIVFDDGISLEESKVIAQKQLIRRNISDIYNLLNPQMANDVENLPNNQEYWFVFFQEIKPANIPFIFMVLVHKETGKIKFANDYNEGNQWILEAELLR